MQLAEGKAMTQVLRVVFLLCFVRVTVGFSCVCSPSECEELSESDCPGGGTVWDPCGCCRVCARVENEPCGGPYGFYGSCAEGLECVVAAHATGKPVLAANSEGICTRIPGSDVRCTDPVRVLGCNMVGHHCKCSEVPVCPGESPFSFTSHDECEMNLAVMLAHEQSDASGQDGANNCTAAVGDCNNLLADDEAPCPPDSVPSDPNVHGSTCVCMPLRCVQPVCRFGSTRHLRRTGTNTPGNCCDVYECVQPKEKNCTDVVCPEEGIECPTDSYRLPNRRAPGDCCSHPQGCECLPSPCPKAGCGNGEHARILHPGNRKPGTCCPLYECIKHEVNITCQVDGDVQQNGSTWWKNQCTQCSCNNGLVFCAERFTAEMQCPELPANCRETRVLPDTCCPVCIDAGHDDSDENTGALPDGCISPTGKVLQNGEDWQDDPCTTCTCVGGVKKCQSFMCVLRCEHPHYMPGECCPLCDSTSVVTLPPHCPPLANCSLRCLHGFVRDDDDGCYTCQCQVEECILECPDGYLQDNHGNKLCECDSSNLRSTDCPALSDCRKNCSHGFRLNKAGCEVCKCKECRPLTDCNKNCTYGLRTNDRGCPICKCQAAEHFPEPVSTNHIITERTCISAVGQHHDDGETWFDGCRLCYCHGGTEMCNLISCPVLTCSNPIFNSTQDCCPHCPDSKFQHEHSQAMVCHSVDGAYRVEGETWLLDTCTKCICHMGRVLCEINQCAPVPCAKPVYKAGQCCPQCPELPSIQSTELANACESHSHGSMWMENNCRSCICVDGKTSCFVQQCQNVACNRPVLAKHQCCPMCVEQLSPKACAVGNVTYHLGDEWNEDACTHCKCSNDGKKTCTEKVCSVSCKKKIKVPGKCCPVCTDPIDSEAESAAEQPLGLFMESTYLVTILILLCITIILALCMGHKYCRNRQQLKLAGTPKSCPNPVYHDYAHTDSYPPPHYNSSDHHRSKVDPYQYRYVPTYDSQQINDMLKSSTIGVTEKTALAPV